MRVRESVREYEVKEVWRRGEESWEVFNEVLFANIGGERSAWMGERGGVMGKVGVEGTARREAEGKSQEGFDAGNDAEEEGGAGESWLCLRRTGEEGGAMSNMEKSDWLAGDHKTPLEREIRPMTLPLGVR